MLTTRSACPTPAGDSSRSALAIVTIAVVAPTPMPIDSTATTATSGVRRRPRSASRVSVASDSAHSAPRASRAWDSITVTLPNSRRAAMRASAPESPRAANRSAACSRWPRISSCISRSRRRKKRAAHTRRIIRAMKDMALGSLENGGEGAGEPFPLVALRGELFAAGVGERVDAGAAAGIGVLPRGADESALFEPVERGIERAGVDVQHVAGHCLYALREIVAVGRLGAEHLEDDQVQRALEERDGFGHGSEH